MKLVSPNQSTGEKGRQDDSLLIVRDCFFQLLVEMGILFRKRVAIAVPSFNVAFSTLISAMRISQKTDASTVLRNGCNVSSMKSTIPHPLLLGVGVPTLNILLPGSMISATRLGLRRLSQVSFMSMTSKEYRVTSPRSSSNCGP